jgi:hypothetical protein
LATPTTTPFSRNTCHRCYKTVVSTQEGLTGRSPEGEEEDKRPESIPGKMYHVYMLLTPY